MSAIFWQSAEALARAGTILAAAGCVFVLLALLTKRRRAIADAFRASAEIRINLFVHFFDAVAVAPFMALISTALAAVVPFTLLDPHRLTQTNTALVVLMALLAGDFIGYWRHRLEHSALLWPSHALHHSDTEMNWLTLARFHPLNRLSTSLIDSAFLVMLGLPPYAIVANNMFRHYYGYFEHADLPWTYGPLRYILVSPVMHRWHHADDPAAYNTNFASVFSFYDVMFGTFRLPGACDVRLGVTGVSHQGLLGQMLYPFRPSSYARLIDRVAARWPRRAPAGMPAVNPAATEIEPAASTRGAPVRSLADIETA